MFTLFSCPKPFSDPHTALIQRNAIRSWMALRPKPAIILVGDETGVAEICREFGLTHITPVERNAYGTPLLHDVFRRAEAAAQDDVVCYINADIILFDSFVEAIRLCRARKGRWLMGGRPWNLSIQESLPLDPGWQTELRARTLEQGALRWQGACDYFAYPKGLWGELPPFAVGRSNFDLALLYLARKKGAALVDGTHHVTAVHQDHPYPAHLCGEQYVDNAEAHENVRLAGGWGHIYTWNNATHTITGGAIERYWAGTFRFWGYFSPTVARLEKHVWYPMLGATRWLRVPLGLRLENLRKMSDRLDRVRHPRG